VYKPIRPYSISSVTVFVYMSTCFMQGPVAIKLAKKAINTGAQVSGIDTSEIL